MQKTSKHETQKESEGCLASLLGGIFEAAITVLLTSSLYGLYLIIGMAAAWLLLPYLVLIYYVFGRKK